VREFQLGVIGGAIYGASHTLSGHSLDNLKARLQLDPGYAKLSTVGAAKKLWGEHHIKTTFHFVPFFSRAPTLPSSPTTTMS
jgi:hypothetical protein